MWIGELIAFIFLGVASGLASGLLGVGGGTVIVPVLVVIFKCMGFASDVVMPLSSGTSLAVMAITAGFGLPKHIASGRLVKSIFIRMLPYLVIGTLLGALLAKRIPAMWLSLVLGAFLLTMAWRLSKVPMLKPNQFRPFHPPRMLYRLVGCGVGLLSGLIGVSGGAFTVPFFMQRGWGLPQAISTSSALIFPVALVGACSFMLIGHVTGQVPWVSGFVYWPAVLCIAPLSIVFIDIGSRLSEVLPVLLLRKILMLLLLILGLKMMIWA